MSAWSSSWWIWSKRTARPSSCAAISTARSKWRWATTTAWTPSPLTCRPRPPLGSAHLVRRLDLTQNLRFPQHERVEARGYPECVADSGVVAMPIEPVFKEGERSPGPFRQEARNRHLGLLRVVCDRIDLHPVTGREHEPLVDSPLLYEAFEERGQRCPRKVEALPDLHRRCRVIEPNRQDHHGSVKGMGAAEQDTHPEKGGQHGAEPEDRQERCLSPAPPGGKPGLQEP